MENVTGINCKYYHSEEFTKQFSGSKCFSAFHLNIASLSKHFDELQTLLSHLGVNFSFIGITESKFLKDTQPAINPCKIIVLNTPQLNYLVGELFFIFLIT